MNSQGEKFDELYDNLLKLLKDFTSSALSGSISKQTVQSVMNAITNAYAEAYTDEVEFILKALELELNDTERNNIRNKVGTSTFARENYKRLAEILSRRAEDLSEISKDEKKATERKQEQATNIAELLATSELHMAIERASVSSSVVIQDVLGVKLVKKWNSQLDDQTCKICEALHGTTIPVEKSFAKTSAGSAYAEELDYGGSDIAYAHPRCRCWLTYEKA